MVLCHAGLRAIARPDVEVVLDPLRETIHLLLSRTFVSLGRVAYGRVHSLLHVWILVQVVVDDLRDGSAHYAVSRDTVEGDPWILHPSYRLVVLLSSVCHVAFASQLIRLLNSLEKKIMRRFSILIMSFAFLWLNLNAHLILMRISAKAR